MSGKETAEVFYDNDKFKHDSAALNRILNTLLGKDGEEHGHRKSIFMDFMIKDILEEIANLVEEERINVLP